MDNDSTVFVGLDVHKDSIAIDRMVSKLSGHDPLQLVYEAGPCGFWLHRYRQRSGLRGGGPVVDPEAAG